MGRAGLAGPRASTGGRGGSPLQGRAARPAQSPAARGTASHRPGRGNGARQGNGGSLSPVVPGRWRYGGSECPARGFLSPVSPLPSSRRLVTLARGLAPAFLRFAGKRTDFLQFHNVKNPAKSRGGPGPDYYLKNYEDGEPRGRRGGRALQRGLREPGGPAPPAPLSPRPVGPCRARARCRRAPGRAQFPYPLFLGRGEPRSSAQLAPRIAGGFGGCRPLGTKDQQWGAELFIFPRLAASSVPLCLRAPGGQRQPQRRLPRLQAAPGIEAPGCLCTPHPALLPPLSGAFPHGPRRCAPFRARRSPLGSPLPLRTW